MSVFGQSQRSKLAEHSAHLKTMDGDLAPESAEPADSDNELWLVSYADLMTLLFGFFVLMYVFASQHTAATAIVQKQIAKQFGGEAKSYVAHQAEEIRSRLRDFSTLKDIEVFEDTEGVTLLFKNQLLFDTGSAEMTDAAQATLNSVISQIRGAVIDSPIVIEGHTDDRALVSKTFKDNWDLSAARAVAVLRAFENQGFAANHLSATGMGSSRPLAPNRDARGEAIMANMDLNRRVVIRIHLAKDAEKAAPESPSKP